MKNENENNGIKKMTSPSNQPITMDEFLGVSGSSKPIKPNNATQLQRKPRPSRSGTNNPFYGQKHSAESKAKMSNSQRARYQMLKQNLKNEAHATSLKSIIREVIETYLKDVLK